MSLSQRSWVPLLPGLCYSVKGESVSVNYFCSWCFKKSTYGFANVQKSNVYRKPFPASWRCQCPRAAPDLRSWGRAADYLPLARRAPGTQQIAGTKKTSWHCWGIPRLCCGWDGVSLELHWDLTSASRELQTPSRLQGQKSVLALLRCSQAVLWFHWGHTGVSLGSLQWHSELLWPSLAPQAAVRAELPWQGQQGGRQGTHTALLTCLLSGSVPCWPCRQAISLFWARWHTDLTVSRRLSICSAPRARGGRENNTKTRSYFPGLSTKPSPRSTRRSGLQISQILRLTKKCSCLEEVPDSKNAWGEIEIGFLSGGTEIQSELVALQSGKGKKHYPAWHLSKRESGDTWHLRWMHMQVSKTLIQGENCGKTPNFHCDLVKQVLKTHLTAPSHCSNLCSKFLLHLLPWLLNTRTKLPHAEQNSIFRKRLLGSKWDMELKNRSQSPNKSSVYQHLIQTWLNTQPVNRTNIYRINCSFKGF